MDLLPPPCAGGCGRPVRPHNATPNMYPTTRTWRIKARGMCVSCHQKAPKAIKPSPGKCVDCGVGLRAKGAEATAGTRVHDGNGRCTACRSLSRRRPGAEPRTSTPVECVSCEHPLRPRHSSKDEHPGTKEHAGKGLCRGCENKVRKGRLDAATLPAPTFEVKDRSEPKVASTVTDPAAARFLEERRARAERAERIKAARVAQEAARARFLATRRAA